MDWEVFCYTLGFAPRAELYPKLHWRDRMVSVESIRRRAEHVEEFKRLRAEFTPPAPFDGPAPSPAASRLVPPVRPALGLLGFGS